MIPFINYLLEKGNQRANEAKDPPYSDKRQGLGKIIPFLSTKMLN